MDAPSQALEDCDGRDVVNVDKDVKVDNEKPRLDRTRADVTEYPTQDFVTRMDVQNTGCG